MAPRRGRRAARLGVARLAPVACLVSAVAIAGSEALAAFAFVPPGGEVLAEQGAGERHGYALALIGAFAIAATLVAVLAGSRPAAASVAAAGAIALLVIVAGDVPDAGDTGTLEGPSQSYFDAEAVPRAGFWVGLVAALALTVGGAALAALDRRQLAALRPGARARGSAVARERQAGRRRRDAQRDAEEEEPSADAGGTGDGYQR